MSNRRKPMGHKTKPDWAGDDLLARFVNRLIQTKPLYKLMKYQARQVLIKTAEKKGILWRQEAETLAVSSAQSMYHDIENANIVYPDYYQVPFHAYESGNLCWQAAFEAAAATKSMALRVWPQENLSWQDAQHRLRKSFHNVIEPYCPPSVQDILDLGCSVGLSTLTLHHYFEKRQLDKSQIEKRQNHRIRTVGLDLSPYMLSVARVLDPKHEIAQWHHGLAEDTPFSDQSFDLIAMQFVLHELPRHASQAIFREVLRLLRPGGCFAIVDNNPLSPVIQNLPPALFVLMKSTEPWSDDYYTFDVQAALQTTGFEIKTITSSDPRHRTIVATKPTK